MQQFKQEAHCYDFIELIKWNDFPVCPYCDDKMPYQQTTFHTYNKRFKCRKCDKYFNLLTGTVFNKTEAPLTTWFRIIELLSRAPLLPTAKIATDCKTDLMTAKRIRTRIGYIIDRTPHGITMPDIILFDWTNVSEDQFKVQEEQLEVFIKENKKPKKDQSLILQIHEVRNIRVALMYGLKDKEQISREYHLDMETVNDIEDFTLYPAIKI